MERWKRRCICTIQTPSLWSAGRRLLYEEVVNEENQQLDETTRYLAILAVLLGTQSVDAYRYYLPKAVEAGVTPVMVKETVYQATDYLGFRESASVSDGNK